jgi:glycerophosphoryl diester phosphodiesterase
LARKATGNLEAYNYYLRGRNYSFSTTKEAIAQARQMGLNQLCPAAHTVTPELVCHLHAAGFVVRAWGVTNEALMRRVVDAGADGMTVDFPDKLAAYLQSLCRQGK